MDTELGASSPRDGGCEEHVTTAQESGSQVKERSLTEGPRGAEEEHWTGRQGSPAQAPAPALVDWVR